MNTLPQMVKDDALARLRRFAVQTPAALQFVARSVAAKWGGVSEKEVLVYLKARMESKR